MKNFVILRKNSQKNELEKSKPRQTKSQIRKKKLSNLSSLERKELLFKSYKKSIRKRKKWYYANYSGFKLKAKLRLYIKRLSKKQTKLQLFAFIRWIWIDFLRGKGRKFWGIYQFVALPGEGKTLSMVAHMERCRKERDNLFIATNFNYKHENAHIGHWTDIIKYAKIARSQQRHCIIAVDEVHITFDSSDWKSFPPEMLALLSFNRKYGLQFICSSQIYERIPKKIRDISNYTVICKNTLGLDRRFVNYYFPTIDYEEKFVGKRSKAEFIRTYIADDYLYSLYNTLEQVEQMTAGKEKERDKKQEAFDLLFGKPDDDLSAEVERLAQAERERSLADKQR